MPAEVVKSDMSASHDHDPAVTLISLVRNMGKFMVDELVDRLHAAGFAGFNASHHPVFESINPGGTRLTELAARAAMTHQSMGELVVALEERGFVTRKADPTDRRARLVCLTPRGRRLARRALTEIAEIEQSWRQRFEAAGCPHFAHALETAVRDAARQ